MRTRTSRGAWLALGVSLVGSAIDCGARSALQVDGTAASSSSSGDPNTCPGLRTHATQVPLDMFIMLDQSLSMDEAAGVGQTKWQRVTAAIGAFVEQPSASGISVGIQYFGVVNDVSQCKVFDCNIDADCGPYPCGPCTHNDPGSPTSGVCNGALGGDSCYASDYAVAEVPIAPLPGNASAIVASIGQHIPSTLTPTSAALQGSIDYATQWAAANPSHVVVDVFATDGNPSECELGLDAIDAIAASGANATPRILTYVIGVGPSLEALDGIAKAGGTITAFHVDSNPNANQQLLDALNLIRASALSCAYELPKSPDGAPIDTTRVNVIYTPGTGAPAETLGFVASAASCAPGADQWHYDDAAIPKEILLCPDACAHIAKDSGAELDIVVGCSNQTPR